MRYREFLPGRLLQPYVQCYFTCESDTAVVTVDNVFAVGYVELMFNLGPEGPQRIVSDGLARQPRVQLWGQTIRPFTFTSSGKHAMLGIRFFPHTAAYFFDEPIALFNDQVMDFSEVGGSKASLFYEQLLEAVSLEQRTALVEQFLLGQLSLRGQKLGKLKLVGSILRELSGEDFFENMHSVAARYGITSRYLQQIFVNYSGLSPGLYSKIARFQKSLQLVTRRELPLTTIAYQCGYYDQSHFIKDFKFFTGSAPSFFSPESSTDLFIPLAG